jgi:hypothetical protein
LFGQIAVITATFKVGKADVLAMGMHYYESSPTARRSRNFTHASVVCVTVLVAALGFFRDGGFLLFTTPLLLMAAAWAVFFPRCYREYQLYTLEKLLQESSYQKAFGAYTVNLDEKLIASSSPIGEGMYLWPFVSRISLTRDYLFIFLAGPQGYPIPRAQVPEATIQEMKAFAEQMRRRAEPGAAPLNAGSGSPPPASAS